jgi:hypothetical protein
MRCFLPRLKKIGYASYDAYLASKHWQDFRRRYADSGLPMTCACCGVKASSLHHCTYRNLGRETFKDVIPVCRPCHVAIHECSRLHKVSLENTSKLIELVRTGKAPDPKPLRKGSCKPIGLVIKNQLRKGMAYSDAVKYAYRLAGKPFPG